LVELTVALAVSGILTLGLVRFFKDFNHTFNLQEQVADRDLNAHYTVKRISEACMATGANLPSEGWTMIRMPEGNPGPRLTLSVNPRGGVQYLAVPLVNALEAPIDDAKAFMKATAVLADPLAAGLPTSKVPIDVNYNSNGFVKGIKESGKEAFLRLSEPHNLAAGDALYAYDEEDFRLQDGNLTLDGQVLAENIQDLKFSLFTTSQALTTQWSAMRSAKIEVVARTRAPDPAYDQNEGYRTLKLSMDVLLRNRL
jgi:hypothetical protein